MRPQTNFVVHLVRLVTFKPLDIADTAAANTTELSPTASRVRTRSSLRIAHRTSTATQSKGDSAKQTTRTTIIPPPLILINGHRPSYYTQQVLTEPLLTTKLPTLGQSFVSQPSSSSTNMSQNDHVLPTNTGIHNVTVYLRPLCVCEPVEILRHIKQAPYQGKMPRSGWKRQSLWI